ncbi:MAG TPA: uracil-DNA glycosylase [Micavibrio sp.]
MTQNPSIKLEKSWLDIIGGEFNQPYMGKLKLFLQAEKAAGQIVYPKGDEIFNALNTTSFDKVRVVIIGQDPYHGEGQAHGLAFSVRKGVAIPPSLVNIYKEIQAEFGVEMPRSGDLTGWARQGVLLLNATLTVQRANAGSHQKKGWEEFTDAVIRAVNEKHEHVVFMLWGSYAQKKGAIIDRKKHLVLEAPHPSPLSAHRGFFGCGHFKKANEYLIKHHRQPVAWQDAGSGE